MNILRRKGKLRIKSANFKEVYTLEDYESENEIPHAESIDKMSVQLSLVLLVYAIVFLFMYGVQSLDMGTFGEKTIKPMSWGTIFGSLTKFVITKLRKHKLMNREYINNYTLDRIAGTCFDFMIVAGTAAIDFNNLQGIWLPLILICTVGAIITFVYVLWCSKYLFPDYTYEGFFSLFGMLTGTASNGMILLREIDPKFETPAANNLVLQAIPAIAFGFPVLLVVGFAPQSLHNCMISLAIYCSDFRRLHCLFLERKSFAERRNPNSRDAIHKNT